MARVLITGASRGIGRASAAALSQRGHEVIATARALRTPAPFDAVRTILAAHASEAAKPASGRSR